MAVSKIWIAMGACLAAAAPLPGVASAYAQGAPKGAALFQQRCAMCHMMNGKGGKIGPDLTGVGGRKAGSGSFSYSPALKQSAIIWNAQTLTTFLTAPSKFVPGTRMMISVPKPDDRKALADFLTMRK